MKWIVILLLTGNVVVLGWQFNERIRAQALASAGTAELPADTPSLRLISELPSLPALRESDKPEAVMSAEGDAMIVEAVDLSSEINSDVVASDVCIAIGPIESKQTLRDLRDWLRERTSALHTRAETVRERRFFWVYLEPASDEQTRRNLDALAERGITDYMLIRRGGLKNAISLGLFRSQDSVNRRLAEMTEKGYKPVVVPKFESTQNFWIRATMAEGFEDTAPMPPDLLTGAILETSTCVEPTVTAEAQP